MKSRGGRNSTRPGRVKFSVSSRTVKADHWAPFQYSHTTRSRWLSGPSDPANVTKAALCSKAVLSEVKTLSSPLSLSPGGALTGMVTSTSMSFESPGSTSIGGGTTGAGCHRVPRMLNVNLAGVAAALVTINRWLTGEAGAPDSLLRSGEIGTALSLYLRLSTLAYRLIGRFGNAARSGGNVKPA